MQAIEFGMVLRQVQNISERNLIERKDPISGHTVSLLESSQKVVNPVKTG
jgi:hypothetical protein